MTSIETTATATTRPGITGEGAGLISEAPPPRPTVVRTFAAMLARDLRVMRRNAISTFTRAVVQPLLFVFVFTYVIPKVAGGLVFGTSRGGLAFATILVPGMVASMLLSQGVLSVTFPLVMEFSWQRTIEDRALAPIPVWLLAVEKIAFGAIQSVIGGLIVFPIVLLVHASGQAPQVHVTNWALLALVMVTAALLAASIGLLLGTMMDPRKLQMLFAVALLPATMLGCVYYPWSALHSIPWLQDVVLVNPMVYMSEGLRAILTPSLSHLPMWAILLVLCGGTAGVAVLGARTFTRRVIS
jgi:ABC-2 type transport system permease protein